jgi:thiol-disulfide isomerase/thioredoxin
MWSRLIGVFAGALLAAVVQAATAAGPSPWYGTDARGEPSIELYFFWSQYCPHCLEARPFVERLAREHGWLRVHSLEVGANRDNAGRYMDMAAQLGQRAEAVPAFLFCGEMHVGYDSAASTGALLEARLQACRARLASGGGEGEATPGVPLVLPLPGGFDPRAWSLPLTTLVLAGLDAFNPCAFFVLLFLLSLMVHARSRTRMLLVGAVFVLFSGLVYFVFMAAWLNVFLLAGELRAVTVAAGAVAVAMALVNIKDFAWFQRGLALSIPQAAKPGLFARARALLGVSSLPAVLTGTVLLALAANAYELLCTAGFPMVYTRMLTLHQLPVAGYYAYLALYNMVYVLPLAAIVIAFALTLGARKLTEDEGRRLKLLSGLMMLGLGVLLLVAPQWLNYPATAVTLLALSLGITWLAGRWRNAAGQKS